jgi:hypothetical protein
MVIIKKKDLHAYSLTSWHNILYEHLVFDWLFKELSGVKEPEVS